MSAGFPSHEDVAGNKTYVLEHFHFCAHALELRVVLAFQFIQDRVAVLAFLIWGRGPKLAAAVGSAIGLRSGICAERWVAATVDASEEGL